MSDEELTAQASSLPTMYFDGFGAYRKINGVLHCIGYVLHLGANLNLVVSLTGADAAQVETKRILSEKPVSGIHIWNGVSLPN